MIVRERADGYRKAHPGPQDVLLIIEVADTSVEFDMKIKARLYAKAGIPEYWVIDVQERSLHVHTGPSARGYKTIEAFEPADVVKSRAVPGLSLKVRELMP